MKGGLKKAQKWIVTAFGRLLQYFVGNIGWNLVFKRLEININYL